MIWRLLGGLLGRQDIRAEPPQPQLAIRPVAAIAGSEFQLYSPEAGRVAPLADGRHLLIEIAPVLWQLAARYDFPQGLLPTEGELLIRVGLWVGAGRVNVIVLDEAGATLTSGLAEPRDGLAALDLRLNAASRPTQVVVQNAEPRPSTASLSGLDVYVVENDVYAEAAAFAEGRPHGGASAPLSEAFDLASPRVEAFSEPPLVSLILTVKNGMPFLREAIGSVKAQSYGRLEVVVQDCLSDDGTSEYLAGVEGLSLDIRREPDSGIGDANNRALTRSRGDIVGSIDSDNLLKPTALETVVEHFRRTPEDAVIYGAVEMITADGKSDHVFTPAPFDLLRLVSNDLVLPWSTSFFQRRRCGDVLRLDPELKTCADFDVWLRMSHLPLAHTKTVLGSTRLSDASMSCRPENYEQFCADKLKALDSYLAGCAHLPLARSLRRIGAVGIYCWAAESLLIVAPDELEMALSFFKRAEVVDPLSGRLAPTRARFPS